MGGVERVRGDGRSGKGEGRWEEWRGKRDGRSE